MENKKTIVISGGTSGIGLATAKLLIAEGYQVVLIGRNKEKGEAVLAQLEANSTQAYFIAADVSKDEQCYSAIEKGFLHFGRIDGLVTAAGQYREQLLQYETPEQIQQLFAVNVWGTISLCQYALPYLRRSGGAIVTLGSDAGLQGNVACSIYGATKGAIVSFSKSYALEVAPYGIRVNCVCPGDVETPLLTKQLKDNVHITMASLREHYPLYRIAKAEEIGHAIIFLLSEKASFITGAAIPVDGGLTSW